MELKSCPFCGEGTAKVFQSVGGYSYYVMCQNCNATSALCPSEQETVEAWNRRYEPPNLPLTLDELRGMDGEPVWKEMIIPCAGCFSGWEILSKRDIDWICENEAIIYGKAFVYYRRRPEEVPK